MLFANAILSPLTRVYTHHVRALRPPSVCTRFFPDRACRERRCYPLSQRNPSIQPVFRCARRSEADSEGQGCHYLRPQRGMLGEGTLDVGVYGRRFRLRAWVSFFGFPRCSCYFWECLRGVSDRNGFDAHAAHCRMANTILTT